MKDKNLRGFQEPNYTQIPNDIFIMLPQLGEAELKFILAVCRLTFGYHQEEAEASLTTLQKMTGLSRPAVVAAAKKLEEIRGLITKKKKKGVNVWLVNIVNQSLVNNLNLTSKRSKPESFKKEVKINDKVEEKEEPEPQIELPFPTNPNLNTKLDQVKEQLKSGSAHNIYISMIDPILPLAQDNNTLILIVKDTHHQDWAEAVLTKPGYLNIFRGVFNDINLKIKTVLIEEL